MPSASSVAPRRRRSTPAPACCPRSPNRPADASWKPTRRSCRILPRKSASSCATAISSDIRRRTRRATGSTTASRFKWCRRAGCQSCRPTGERVTTRRWNETWDRRSPLVVRQHLRSAEASQTTQTDGLSHLHQKPRDGDGYARRSRNDAQHRKHALPRNEVQRAEHQSDLQQPLAYVVAQGAVLVGFGLFVGALGFVPDLLARVLVLLLLAGVLGEHLLGAFCLCA